MDENFDCWWIASLGISFKCCEDCHENGKYHANTLIAPDGTAKHVCCAALLAYIDQSGRQKAQAIFNAHKAD